MARIATAAEVEAGTNDESFVTPAKLKPVVAQLAKTADLTTHTGSKSNPHGVTKAQVGLGNVDNTADANKPVSAAQKSYVDNFQPAITALSATSGTLTLAVNKVYSAAITGNTTFSLPTPGNKTYLTKSRSCLKLPARRPSTGAQRSFSTRQRLKLRRVATTFILTTTII